MSVPLDSLAAFRPWLAAQALEGALFSAAPFNRPNADQVLVARARSLSIPVSSEFPTLTDATRWLAGLSPTSETQYLLYIIDEVLMGQERGQHIYAQWDSGNSEPARIWMSRMARNYPELYRAMDVRSTSSPAKQNHAPQNHQSVRDHGQDGEQQRQEHPVQKRG